MLRKEGERVSLSFTVFRVRVNLGASVNEWRGSLGWGLRAAASMPVTAEPGKEISTSESPTNRRLTTDDRANPRLRLLTSRTPRVHMYAPPACRWFATSPYTHTQTQAHSHEDTGRRKRGDRSMVRLLLPPLCAVVVRSVLVPQLVPENRV